MIKMLQPGTTNATNPNANMKKNLLVLLTSFVLVASASAQFNQAWNGKKCAVVLTYDDAINQHLDNAIPVLDSLGLKATFYVTAFSPSMQTRLNDWKKLAVNGHELANHTLYHPCVVVKEENGEA
jgi:sialate O-acetylesterase